MLVCALLEDAVVLDNLDDILAVPGIDLYGIGPHDLAQSLGYPGEPDHPEVGQGDEPDRHAAVHAAGKKMQLDVMNAHWVTDMLDGGRPPHQRLGVRPPEAGPTPASAAPGKELPGGVFLADVVITSSISVGARRAQRLAQRLAQPVAVGDAPGRHAEALGVGLEVRVASAPSRSPRPSNSFCWSRMHVPVGAVVEAPR
jgi:hypothetical protein